MRLYNLDLLKALAIVAMILCHSVLILGVHHEGYENEFLYWFGDVLEYSFPHYVIYLFGIALIFVSFYLARFWKKHKNKKSLKSY